LFFIYFLLIRRVGAAVILMGEPPVARLSSSAPEITFVLALSFVALNTPTVSRLPARNHQVANQSAILL
jgi:hypothetical protein